MSSKDRVLNYVLAVPYVLVGIAWGAEMAIERWVRRATQRPGPR